MNEMTENKYPYDNWKSITESDFVTLFIKTWFAFVSTLREMYPQKSHIIRLPVIPDTYRHIKESFLKILHTA